MKTLIQFLRNNAAVIFFITVVFIFFYPFFLKLQIPIPADTIVGMFHPFRDNVWDGFTQGVPFKNFLITDPVRQQYPWRFLSIDTLKNEGLPLWNPYSFSGTPLLGNFQSASLYPLNILFFIFPFSLTWGILIIVQPLLAGLFLYSYLRFLKTEKISSLIGAVAFTFSGFTIAWLEWNTIIHTLLWLPLILLSTEHILKKITWKWIIILFIAQICAILGGHLQVLFYITLLSLVYCIGRVIQRRSPKSLAVLAATTLASTLITSLQTLPTIQFILLSARTVDQGAYTKEGWFIPWQNLIQFIAPDFFGNPATANYWGVWNYGEFIGYIGILPLILALYALIWRKDKKVLFFGTCLFLSLAFSLPSFISYIPYQLNIPFLTTAQPTRLLSIAVISLSILAALGFDHFMKGSREKMKEIIIVISSIGVIFIILWLSILLKNNLFKDPTVLENLIISKRNMMLPTAIFFMTALLLITTKIIKKGRIEKIIYCALVGLLVLDVFRFGWKFIPFSNTSWLYPKTKILEYLQKNIGNQRFLSLDRRIMPPNFSVMYNLQDVSGYDPLYINRYGEFIAAVERGKPDISAAAFNRIITPTNITSPFINLLGVEYVLTIDERNEKNLRFIMEEGETKLYRNINVRPRAFIVESIINAKDDQDEINKLYQSSDTLDTVATTQHRITLQSAPLKTQESATITDYKRNYVKINTNTAQERLLILTDIFYPTWTVFVDGEKKEIYRVDYTLRGVLVPQGNHIVEFKNTLGILN